MTESTTVRVPVASALLYRVPEVTLFFWVIKILATTVGETAADFLYTTLGLGLTGTSLVMATLLAVALGIQFRARRYVPAVYWTVVVLVSVVGTLVTDNLTDNLGVSLVSTTTVFFVGLMAVFIAWYRTEGTLSIHGIVTARREGFSWLTILLTFALGTAAGDLLAERWAFGYGPSAVLFAAAIAAIFAAHRRLGLGAIPAFWAAYVLTRPLGASVGDLLSQARADGGLGLGTSTTSAVFLVGILGLVTYLARSRRDRFPAIAIRDVEGEPA